MDRNQLCLKAVHIPKNNKQIELFRNKWRLSSPRRDIPIHLKEIEILSRNRFLFSLEISFHNPIKQSEQHRKH